MNDFSRLGSGIGVNTHLTSLRVWIDEVVALDVTNNEFYDGLKQNSSVSELSLFCDVHNIVGGVGQKILEVYQANSNLTVIGIINARLQNGGDQVVAATLRNCTNLKNIDLHECNMNII